MPEITKIGKLIKPHGLKGQVSLLVENINKIDFDRIKMLFIEINNTPTPFFIENIIEAGGKMIVKFENINSEADIKKLLKKDVSVLSEYIEESDNLSEDKLIGFTLIDEKEGILGTIIDVQEFPQHAILSLLYKNKEILLPLTDDFINKIDWDTKTIYYKAPEGLLDVYLES